MALKVRYVVSIAVLLGGSLLAYESLRPKTFQTAIWQVASPLVHSYKSGEEMLQTKNPLKYRYRYREVYDREGKKAFTQTKVRLQDVDLLGREELSIDRAGHRMAYFGGLHSHTSWSDGKASPEEAWRFARDVGHVDFWAVTDHAEYWLFRQDQPWKKLQEIASSMTTKDFIALRGFEHSHPVNGHMVVLFSRSYCGFDRCPTLGAFYQWLEKEPGALAVFAHPGFRKDLSAPIEFNHFAPPPGGPLKQMIGMEVIHWSGFEPFLTSPWQQTSTYFDMGLIQGWTLGPLGSQDNHSANWGASGSNRVALLLNHLSEENIYQALQQHRFYATSNDNLHFAFNVRRPDGPWLSMGEEMALPPAPSTVEFSVRYFDADLGHPPRRLEILCDGMLIAKSEILEKPSGPWTPYVAGEFTAALQVSMQGAVRHWCYARFFQGYQEDVFTQSAPVWFF